MSVPVALQAVTSSLVAVLSLSHLEGALKAGADADFVVLRVEFVTGQFSSDLVVDQV